MSRDEEGLRSIGELYNETHKTLSPVGLLKSAFGGDSYRSQGGMLLAIIVASAIPRLAAVSRVSVWYDDWASVAWLNAPTFGEYMSQVRFLNPDHLPVYFVTQWVWSRAFGASPVDIRLLSILLSVACVLVVYLLGRQMGFGKAGLLAAACMALSPLHIWYSWSLRYTPLFQFLAGLSILCLWLAVKKGRGWWLALYAVNITLMYTHILSLVLLGVEGMILLLAASGSVRRRLLCWGAWGGAHGAAAVGAILWLRSSADYALSLAEDTYHVSGWNVLIDLFGDDAAQLAQPWMLMSKEEGMLPPNPYEAFINGSHWWGWIDRAFLAMVVLGVLMGCFRLFRSFSRSRQESGNRLALILPLLLVFVPVLTLTAASRLLYPCLQPQYTIYSLYAIYLLVGAIPFYFRRAMQVPLVALIVVMYLVQLAPLMAMNSRPDWLGAARLVTAQAGPGDVVLVRGRFFSKEVFDYVLDDERFPVLASFTLDEMVRQSGCLLRDHEAEKRVWLVINVAFDYAPLPLDALESALDARNLEWSSTFFPGMGDVAVYEVRRQENAGPDVAAETPSPKDPPTVEFIGRLTDDNRAGALNADDVRRVARSLEASPPVGPYTWTLFSFRLSDIGCFNAAVWAADRALEFRPGMPLAHFAQAIALCEQGNGEAGLESFESAMRNDRIHFIQRYEPLFRAIYVDIDEPKAEREAARLDQYNAFLPESLRFRTLLRRLDCRNPD